MKQLKKTNILLLLLLLAFAGTASAADYYVSTTGSNSASGDLTHPWQNVSHATQQAVAGDTIHLFDEVWYGEECSFANSGTSGNPITLTAYSGQPEMDGVDYGGNGISVNYKDYINIHGIKMHRYLQAINDPGDYLHVSNCEIYDTANVVMVISRYASTHNTLENCTVHDSGGSSNMLQVSGNREPPNGIGTPATYITIKNNTLYNAPAHNVIDIFGNFNHVLIQGNTIYNNLCDDGGIMSHDPPDWKRNITICDNIIYDVKDGIRIAQWYDCTIYNNTIYDVSGAPIEGKYGIENDNITCTDNDLTGLYERIRFTGINLVFAETNLHGGTIRIDARGTVRSDAIIRDNYDKSYSLSTRYGSDMVVEYVDGRIFSRTITGTGTSTAIKWTPTKAWFEMGSAIGTDKQGASITSWDATLMPTSDYLYDVTMHHEADAADDRTNISADSSVSSNPTTITATMQNASNTYKVYVDGGYVASVISNAAGVATYQYSSGWSTAHTFEFDWFSDTGFAGAPDPTNLQSTKSSTWVNHTWDVGSGNITDSYNVSKNSVWSNGSATEYWHQTEMSPGDWSNISVWAYNNTGGISQNSVSQNIQTDSSGWSPSIFGNYYNTTNPILITTRGYGDFSNLFNRTPTQTDGNATSGRLVVTI